MIKTPNSNPIQRYQNLRFKESLRRPYRYSLACKELSLFLRSAYSMCPKNLQSQIFQDTLFAFSLLPEIQVQSAISAANSLLQSAEFALPKQKRGLAVKEYKHAVVACKRKSKSLKEEEVLTVLPRDVLFHVFGFLDLQSLVSAAAVCRSWNAVASDNHLWKSLHATFFGKHDSSFKINGSNTDGTIKSKKDVHSANHAETKADTDWRNAFERDYREICSRRFKSHRGYCSSCGSIVWLNSNKCSDTLGTVDNSTHQINPLSTRQLVEYILGGSFSSESSSDGDSDSDTDDNSFCKLWAYELS
ncbi:F-box protein At5g52880 [Primulina huaijiensis]|uniref:F-box protein At5g52880 n=1 Tax=Primulina huaijiensis TaxID=1492673 RepID=UPI003CC786C0